jgi:hypothetical protein
MRAKVSISGEALLAVADPVSGLTISAEHAGFANPKMLSRTAGSFNVFVDIASFLWKWRP